MEWKSATGLPFVFACWTATRKLDEAFFAKLNHAFKTVIDAIELIPESELPNAARLYDYIKSHISYHFSGDKESGLKRFIDFISDPVDAGAAIATAGRNSSNLS
jgi:chorismate dehydratase